MQLCGSLSILWHCLSLGLEWKLTFFLILFFLSTLTLFSVPETCCSSVSCSVVQLFATPWTAAYKAPVSMGLSRQEYCSGLPFCSLRELPDQGNEPGHTALQADSLPSELQGSWNMLFSSVQSLSHVQHFATQWTAAYQVSLSISNSWSLLKLISIRLVMTSNHLILCHPLFLLPLVFPNIRVFFNGAFVKGELRPWNALLIDDIPAESISVWNQSQDFN